MNAMVGDIAISVGADISPLRRGLRQGSQEIGSFAQRAQRHSAKIKSVGIAVAATMSAASAAAVVMARDAAAAGSEIANLSKIANTSASEFQRWAAGASSVGIEQEKLADILKDVNDRVGDFMSTGGGPMADFFEQVAPLVGVTADQFARLSGPEALQLYVSTLQDAGASQQQMTFYLEAMASDATALLPLLRDNGSAMAELGDAAEASGRIMSDEAVRAATELNRKFGEISTTLRTSLHKAILDNADDFSEAADAINETIVPALGAAAAEVATFIAKVISLGVEVSRTLKKAETGSVGRNGDARKGDTGPGVTTGTPLQTTVSRTNRRGETTVTDVMSDLMPPAPVIQLEPVIVSPGDDLPELGETSGDIGAAGSGGGAGGLGRDGFESLRESLMTERELIENDRAERMAELEAYREAELAKEGEYAEAKQRIQEQYLTAVRELEERERAAKLAAMASVAGEISALMSSENKKLFALGKASAIAESTITGYSAAVKAWDKGMAIGGPAVAGAYAGLSLLKTGSMIASIASTQIGGSGGSSSATAGAGTAATSESSAAQQQVVVNMTGDTFSRESVLQFMEQVLELTGEGANVMVNRS